MTPSFATKRPSCAVCLRPQRTCLCRWVVPTESKVEVLIMQHPLEVRNAKGSARLLHLCLPRSRMVVGETFDEQELRQLLHAPFDEGTGEQERVPVLLYPDTPHAGSMEQQAPAALDQALMRAPDRLRLVVLDGTWRKSLKMLCLNPLLQRLPRLPLITVPASQYRIRKAHRADQLSTLEATCHALMQMENDAETVQPLLAAFDAFVMQQAAYFLSGRGDEVAKS